jgi:hypothetical protein
MNMNSGLDGYERKSSPAALDNFPTYYNWTDWENLENLRHHTGLHVFFWTRNIRNIYITFMTSSDDKALLNKTKHRAMCDTTNWSQISLAARPRVWQIVGIVT